VYFSGIQRIREVWANYNIAIPNFHLLHLVDILRLPNNIDVHIDEAYRWFESRLSMSYVNLMMSYLIFELRKRLMDVYVSVQMFSTLDIRLREQADKIIYCEPRSWNSTDDFYYTIETKVPFSREEFCILYDDAIPIFEMYDTFEILPLRNQKAIEFTLLEDDPDMMLPKIEEIIETIKPTMNKITKESVRAQLTLNKIYQGYAPMVWLFMKELIFNKNLQVPATA